MRDLTKDASLILIEREKIPAPKEIELGLSLIFRRIKIIIFDQEFFVASSLWSEARVPTEAASSFLGTLLIASGL